MPIPLIPVIAALAAGGTLVPHAAGGFIVTSAIGGYVAGTYVGTAAITSILALATASLGVGATIVTGAATTLIGGAGIFGTTVGATGVTGALMSAGILSSTPIIWPILAGCSIVGGAYAAYCYRQLMRKVSSATSGEEAHFSNSEAIIIEAILKSLSKKGLIGKI